MGWLTDWITGWLKGLLIDGIMGNFTGLFNDVNKQVGEIATQVGTSPATWNAGVFALIKQLSETVVLPIAGMILTFVMCYELISLIHLDFLQVDFQDLCGRDDSVQHVQYCAGGV